MPRKRKQQPQSLTRESLENFGSLITVKDTDECLGDLWHVDSIPDEHGKLHHDVTFDPNHGRVPVTKEEAQAHNIALDQARLEGLDNQCKVGQGDFGYTGHDAENKTVIRTFSGTTISDHVELNIRTCKVLFRRGERIFEGTVNKDGMVHFRRIK